MNSDTTARLIYLGLLLAAAIGPLFLSLRTAPARTLQQLLIWAFLFLGVIAIHGLWPDLKAALLPSRVRVMSENRIELRLAEDGHFHAELRVNGVAVTFLVDTGASGITLSREDAARVGIDPAELSFTGQAETANGAVTLAPIRLATVQLGPWKDHDIPAAVNNGAMQGSLLGMAYLGRFQMSSDGTRLILSRQ
ncbi:MAG: TIGR02281 family clan AA aspartic protease [Rhodobacteraceae bacterium]|nr:TIGR02281 family clan AA aspartic protease [Paracoccaceae bacterium]